MTLVPDMHENWWTLICPVVDGFSAPENLYGNIGCPGPGSTPTTSGIEIVDLELDVIWSDDAFVLIDVDEFECARKTYPPGVAGRAERTAQDLIDLLGSAGERLSKAASWYAQSAGVR